jgi:hypothetical protein
MNASAAALALESALQDLFPKAHQNMKLIPIPASIVVHVQIHALPEQFQHNRKKHATRVSPFNAGALVSNQVTLA